MISGSPRPTRLPLAAGRAVMALILREVATVYGRSPGGYVWAVLEPVFGIALLTFIFTIGFRAPPLGGSFALFYASGVLPFLVFTDITAKLGQTVPFSRALLRYPRVTLLDALIARLVLNGLIQIVVGVVVLSVLLGLTQAGTVISVGRLALAYALALCLGAGIGTLNAVLNVAVPVWQSVWAIGTRPLFIVSCVFFLFDAVPHPYRELLWYNPLVHVTGMMRSGIYPYYHADYVSPAYVLACAVVPLIAGLLLLRRLDRSQLTP